MVIIIFRNIKRLIYIEFQILAKNLYILTQRFKTTYLKISRIRDHISFFYLNLSTDDFSFINPVCPEDYFDESDGFKVYLFNGLTAGHPSSQAIFDLTCPAKFSQIVAMIRLVVITPSVQCSLSKQ